MLIFLLVCTQVWAENLTEADSAFNRGELTRAEEVYQVLAQESSAPLDWGRALEEVVTPRRSSAEVAAPDLAREPWLI